jgi:hypothetical protein
MTLGHVLLNPIILLYSIFVVLGRYDIHCAFYLFALSVNLSIPSKKMSQASLGFWPAGMGGICLGKLNTLVKKILTGRGWRPLRGGLEPRTLKQVEKTTWPHRTKSLTVHKIRNLRMVKDKKYWTGYLSWKHFSLNWCQELTGGLFWHSSQEVLGIASNQ